MAERVGFNRNISIDNSNILENQKITLPKIFHLTFYQSSLRLRHLTQIIGCNLEKSKDIIEPPLPNVLPSLTPLIKPVTGYYFTLEYSNKSNVSFTSEFQYSECPIWDTFDCSIIFPIHLLSLKGIIIQVWYKGENGESHRITSWGVYFSGLIPIPSAHICPKHYTTNTLILKLRGYYYTYYNCLKNVSNSELEETYHFPLYRAFTLPLSETKPSYSVASLCRLHSTKRAIKQQIEKKERLSDHLEYRGVTKESNKMVLKNKVENRQVKVSILAQHLAVELTKLKNLKRASENLDSENQDKGIELLASYQQLNRQLVLLRNKEEKLNEDYVTLRDIMNKVKVRRLQLLSQLPFVFPIEQINDSKNYTICDVRLPNAESYTGHSESSLSVALGYVAQLLVKIAQILSIPLKYPITLRGSLSSIEDLTSPQLQDMEKHLTHPPPFMPDTIILKPVLPVSLKLNGQAPPTFKNSLKYSSSLSQENKVVESDSDFSPANTVGQSLKTEAHLGKTEFVLSDFSLGLSEPENNFIQPSKKCMSYSLDQGLNYLKDKGTHSLSSGSHLTSKQFNNPTGSDPNLMTPELEQGVDKVDFHEHTTQFLESWHQDNPTPYTSVIFSSSEKIEDDSTDVSHKMNYNTACQKTKYNVSNRVNKAIERNLNDDLANRNQHHLDKFINSVNKNCSVESKLPNKSEVDDRWEEESLANKLPNNIQHKSDENVANKLPNNIQHKSDENVANKLPNTDVNLGNELPKFKDNLGTELPNSRAFIENKLSNSVENLRTKLPNEVQELHSEDSVEIKECVEKNLTDEMEQCLSDFDLDEQLFFNDVASRTANLASQNCSFKFSFRQTQPNS